MGSYHTATQILGNDFITPEEIEMIFDLKYEAAILGRLKVTVPEYRILRWCKQHKMMLVAGPPRSESISELETLPRFTGGKSSVPDMLSGVERVPPFAYREFVEPRWYAVTKGVVPRLRNMTWEAQNSALPELMHVPTAVEAFWAYSVYAEVRGSWPLVKFRVRTLSVLLRSLRIQISLGIDNRYKCDIVGNALCDYHLGIAGCRRF